MTRRLEPVGAGGAGALALPLSMLHGTCFPEDPWDPRAIAEIIGLAGFFGRIAWEDDEPAGLALALAQGHDCEILALGVVPARRRQGMGSALLGSLCAEACRQGAHGIFLEVAADNLAARALYAAAGFAQIGCRRDYYRLADGPVDALVLRRAIAASSST